jgi:hypothetical protein
LAFQTLEHRNSFFLSVVKLGSKLRTTKSFKFLAFQTLVLSFVVPRGFLLFALGFLNVQHQSIEIQKVFFVVYSKSDEGLEIRCQDLDFQTLFAFGPLKFGTKHWRDERINYLTFVS